MNTTLLYTRLKKLAITLSSLRLIKAFIKHGVLASAEHQFVLRMPLEMIVDIGANKGQFTLACRHWIPQAKIISFEPLDGPAEVFQALFKNDVRVSLNKLAIGPKEQRSLIHISSHEDSSSLLPIGPNQILHYPGTDEKGLAEINVAPLSMCLSVKDIKSPSMLKLDVQGYEIEALLGCESLLSSFDFVYCECSFVELYSGQGLVHDVISWLDQRKFKFIGVFNISNQKDGLPIQADFLFKRDAA